MISKLRKDIKHGEVFVHAAHHSKEPSLRWIAIDGRGLTTYPYTHLNMVSLALSWCDGTAACYVLEAHEI